MFQGSTSLHKNTASFVALQEGFQQFSRDLAKLQQFIELNATGFSKVLKKWDKQSKSQTKELYLSRAIEVKPVFNRDIIARLSDEATTSLLQLEAHANGDLILVENTALHGPMAQRTADDVDNEILSAVIGEEENAVAKLISKLHDVQDNKHRITRIFFLAMSQAPTKLLLSILQATAVDLEYEDEINERTILHEAAIAGKIEVMQLAISMGTTVDALDVYGRTPLHYAAIQGSTIMADLLVRSGADIDALDHDNFTSLIHAIVHHNAECVSFLIKLGADVNALDSNGYVPLNLAAAHGIDDIVNVLLKEESKIVADAEGLYPQHLVARSGHHKTLRLLSEHGASVNQQDKLNSWTPLFHAASEGHLAVVEELLNLGARTDILDEKNLSPMYYAAWEGHIKCMDTLYRAGCKPGLGTSLTESLATVSVAAESGIIDSDVIPDLSLPPPMIPVRRYGHNYLESKSLLQLQFWDASIHFFKERNLPATRLAISSKSSSDLLPHNLLLPFSEESKACSFQIADLESLTLDFEIYPSFGSKVLAKSVALQHNFEIATRDKTCSLPLFDPRLQAIGLLQFSTNVIQPFQGTPLEINNFATYWKSTSQIEPRSNIRSSGNSYIADSSLSGEFARIHLQATKDAVPVVYSRDFLPVPNVQVEVGSVTIEQFTAIGLSRVDFERQKSRVRDARTAGEVSNAALQCFVTLKEFLGFLQDDIKLELIIHPAPHSDSGTSTDINSIVDAILEDVFTHAREVRMAAKRSKSIIFSSSRPDICTALNWKQPNCRSHFSLSLIQDAVFYINDHLTPGKKLSIKDAVSFATANNLLGLMCATSYLVCLETFPC